MKADLQKVQQIMRDTVDSSDEDNYELISSVKLDPEMRILNIDVTFDGLGHVASYDNP